jgi:sterol desaturase/sphingolipid hydroxylase (fatty acid hydroxylase superfamily)
LTGFATKSTFYCHFFFRVFMSLIIFLAEYWLTSLAWLAGLSAIFGLLAWGMPCNPGMYWWKDLRAFATDCVYWFIVPLFTRIGRALLLMGGLVLFFDGNEPQVLPVKHWPLWQQCVAVLVLQDVMLYWIHRIFHTRFAWKFHAVHHSPTTVDWMTTTRFHPVNNLLEFGLADVAVVLLGFSPLAVVTLTPFNIVYSAMVHANLNWMFGPFRYVLASPVFHRWHHTTEAQGLDRNFASTFPVLDLIFGTFFMPAGQLPAQYGTTDSNVPTGFWGQLLYPFRGTPPVVPMPTDDKQSPTAAPPARRAA